MLSTSITCAHFDKLSSDETHMTVDNNHIREEDWSILEITYGSGSQADLDLSDTAVRTTKFRILTHVSKTSTV
jgi:hypothetical protein